MKKLFLLVLSFLVLTVITVISYLALFGYETSRFNNTITEIIKKNDENIDLKFEKVKVSLNIKKFSIYVKLTKPKLTYFGSKIPLDSLKADINLFSAIKNENIIKKIIINTQYMDFKSIRPIIVRSKPGNIKTILLNNIKSSKFKINSELEFDDNLELTNETFFEGHVKETSIAITNKYLIKNTNFNFIYRDKLLKISNLKSKFEDLEIFESKVEYKNINNDHELSGDINLKIDSIGKEIKRVFSLYETNLENFDFKSFKASANSSFILKLDKTLAIKDRKFKIVVKADGLTGSLKEQISSKLLKENIKDIQLKDTVLEINHENKNTSYKLISNIKTFEDFFRFEISKMNSSNAINFLVKGNSPIKIPIINYSLNSGNSILKGKYILRNKNEILFPKIDYKINNDVFEIKNLILDNKFYLINFKTINVKTSIDGNFNNNFSITNSLKKKILVNGSSFDAKLLLNELTKNSENNFLKNISKSIEINLDIIFTDTNFPIKKFRLIGDIKRGKFEKISAKSEFKDNKYLDISLEKEKNSNLKVLEIYSDVARPLINSYKFFDGLKDGKLIYESKFDDKNSSSVLRVNDFKLIKAPAFAKLLSLADLQGLTDTLKGEGISFDTLVIKYTNDPKIMKIKEIFMIGPSISILIDGYVENESGLISLRGTLVPAKTLNTMLSKIPVLGNILIGKKDGEGLFGVSFKIKGLPENLKTTVNPVKTLTPRFITRALESIKNKNKIK